MKKEKKYQRIGKIVYYILKVLLKTCRMKRINKDGIMPGLDQNSIYIFWHNKLAAVTGVSEGLVKKAALASPSKDGELISVPLENFGYKVVRGSTGRGSVRSLISMIKLLKEGYVIGTPVDGPKGPVYKAKPGMLYLSQKSGKKVQPIGVAYGRSWCFEKTWDKLLFPKPFSEIICYFGEPFIVGKDENLDEVGLKVEKILNDLDEKAKTYLKNK